MDYKDKIRIALIVVCLTASSLIFTSEYCRRRRRGERHNCPRSSCYLHSDQKPQLRFKRVLADNSFSPFNHLNLKKGSSSSSHPYESEINALIENPFRAGIELHFDANLDIEMSDCYVWVETESQLNELADELSKERVFAVDTEQHSLRSFLGFTALVQISTRKRDYLLDMIALHDVMGVLGPVFANPNICKVFHGADNDVLWLQRDFRIYVVNLFDTAKACEVLLKPQKSLAYLLETYCSVATNKLLQREDWRQRPLSAEMLQYARTDAHYLLYIASSLIVELKQLGSGNSSNLDNKLNYTAEASRRSNMTCLQLYSKETEVPPGESAALSIFSRHLNREGSLSISCETQDFVRCLCAWRDLMDLCINDPFDIGSAITVNQKKSKDKLIKFVWYLYNMARIHDESSRFVLSDQAIVALAEKIPKTQHELSDTISQADLSSDPANINVALQSPSLVVCSHLDDLYALIQGKDVEAENVFQMLLEKCLGPNGCCPLSIYNYALLFNCDLKLTSSTGSKQNGFKNWKQTAQKASRELFVQKFSCKAPVYHNCRIYANDGRLLCYCDRRKLEWYLRRDLAKLVEDDPPAIMLLFEPKGRPEDEGNDFYIQSKKNICVGCGEGSHYLRYRIIPSCYRMHFPEHLKSHRSHDIVLLCVDCHEVAHAAAEKHKKQTAAEFGIPLFVRKVVESKEQPAISWPDASIMHVDEVGISPLQLRTAAMALLRHGERMPSERRNELMQIVMQYYGGREITQEDLQKALLVGMSPHERRKFEKKRGMSKHSGGRNFQQKKQVNNVDTVTKSAIGSVPKIDASHGSQSFSKAEPAGRTEDNGHTFAVTHDDCNASSDLYVVGASATVCKHVNEDDDLGVADDNLRCTGCEGSTPPKNNLKTSLLGHGPHGKQVVNHILEEYGDDGVREFCQRWRKVFVEAIQPRFLPSGWDVMHSGRRDFGDFSIYKPAKKASVAQ